MVFVMENLNFFDGEIPNDESTNERDLLTMIRSFVRKVQTYGWNSQDYNEQKSVWKSIKNGK